MALASKQKKSSTSQIIKVNPYENPENVMELMAKICSATGQDEELQLITKVYTERIGKEPSLQEFLKLQKEYLANPDFEQKYLNLTTQLAENLSLHENTSHTQIVVAGGFSSGKSSFLNRLTNSTGLLPTGVEPVSVVKTYLYCSQQAQSVDVKGINLRNVLVHLEPGVLQAIQHAKQSNIYLASVLEKLFVEIPSEELDGLVFFDTPGYNNSDRANASNGKTDRATALEALGEGNVLFWIVDSERGAIVSDDIEMIKQFEGKKVFIFNKADKKGEQESKKIVDTAATTLLKEFPNSEIIDILAFSTLDNKVYASYRKKELTSILKEVKQTGNGLNQREAIYKEIEKLFHYELFVYENRAKCISRGVSRNTIYALDEETLRCILNGSHPEMLRLERIFNYNPKLSHELKKLTDSCLWIAQNVCGLTYSHRLVDFIHSCKYSNDLYDTFLQKLLDYLRHMQLQSQAGQRNQDKQETNQAQMIRSMNHYKKHVLETLSAAIQTHREPSKITTNSTNIPNVFDCIQRDDYKAFLRSFEQGVDMAVCNTQGYSPLTLAVKQGNNMMVQFLLNHGADPALKDQRGYNAFHTAVEEQYRDICQILLNEDPDLIETTTAQGEDVQTLAQKQSFSRWLETEI